MFHNYNNYLTCWIVLAITWSDGAHWSGTRSRSPFSESGRVWSESISIYCREHQPSGPWIRNTVEWSENTLHSKLSHSKPSLNFTLDTVISLSYNTQFKCSRLDCPEFIIFSGVGEETLESIFWEGE